MQLGWRSSARRPRCRPRCRLARSRQESWRTTFCIGCVGADVRDNTAELKELGAVAGTSGTRQAGLEVIRRTLGEWPTAGFVLADGSGLSKRTR